MAEIRDEGILGNDFAMAHELTVRPCEDAVYLPDLAGTEKGYMGERLPCTIRSVTEVRVVTEETLAVRAVGSATLAPHTVTQVRVIGHCLCQQVARRERAEELHGPRGAVGGGRTACEMN